MTIWQFFNQPTVLAVIMTTLVILALAPIILRLAGLSGDQIVTVFEETTRFILALVADFRNTNENK